MANPNGTEGFGKKCKDLAFNSSKINGSVKQKFKMFMNGF